MGFLLLQQRGGLPARACAGRARAEARGIVDFDVHHGNGTEDIIAGDEPDADGQASVQPPAVPRQRSVPKGTT